FDDTSADIYYSISYIDHPKNADQHTRIISRRVTPKCESHKSLPGWPGMQSIDMPNSFAFRRVAAGREANHRLWWVPVFCPAKHSRFRQGTGRISPSFLTCRTIPLLAACCQSFPSACNEPAFESRGSQISAENSLKLRPL